MFTLIAYTAGADLAELATISTAEAFQRGWLKDLNDALESFRKPIIAAVRGFAVRQHTN
jgi:enoyl-CoA hydratase